MEVFVFYAHLKRMQMILVLSHMPQSIILNETSLQKLQILAIILTLFFPRITRAVGFQTYLILELNFNTSVS